MKRFDPIPALHPGGFQPFQGATPSEPGMALLAMLKGRTSSGYNPQDAWRGMQKTARQGQQSTLLDMLAR